MIHVVFKFQLHSLSLKWIWKFSDSMKRIIEGLRKWHRERVWKILQLETRKVNSEVAAGGFAYRWKSTTTFHPPFSFTHSTSECHVKNDLHIVNTHYRRFSFCCRNGKRNKFFQSKERKNFHPNPPRQCLNRKLSAFQFRRKCACLIRLVIAKEILSSSFLVFIVSHSCKFTFFLLSSHFQFFRRFFLELIFPTLGTVRK